MTVFCVITKVPAPESGGNLASAIVYRQTHESSEATGWLGRYSADLAAVLTYFTEVFSLGEILILDETYGREIGGAGRKPSKWDVDVLHTDSLDEAIAKSREVTS